MALGVVIGMLCLDITGFDFNSCGFELKVRLEIYHGGFAPRVLLML
jgi:hypothetical protein